MTMIEFLFDCSIENFCIIHQFCQLNKPPNSHWIPNGVATQIDVNDFQNGIALTVVYLAGNLVDAKQFE